MHGIEVITRFLGFSELRHLHHGEDNVESTLKFCREMVFYSAMPGYFSP